MDTLWRRGAFGLAVVSIGFTVLGLLFEPYLRADENALSHSVAHHAPGRETLSEPACELELQVALLSQSLANGPSNAQVRARWVAQLPSSDNLAATIVTTFSPDGIQPLSWWKHRRCLCQLLDMPPPLGLSL